VLWAADPASLRERLSAKVQALREQRKADERKQGVEKAKAWKQEQHIAAMKAAKEKKLCDTTPPHSHCDKRTHAALTKILCREAEQGNGKAARTQNVQDASDIMFNRLQVKDPSQRPVPTKKHSKADLLKQAEAKASEAAEVRMLYHTLVVQQHALRTTVHHQAPQAAAETL
jgi:hypothetical protein